MRTFCVKNVFLDSHRWICTSTQQLALKGSIWGHMYISKDHKKDKAHLWIAGYFFNVLGGVFLWTKIYKSMVIFDTRQKITDVSYLFFWQIWIGLYAVKQGLLYRWTEHSADFFWKNVPCARDGNKDLIYFAILASRVRNWKNR